LAPPKDPTESAHSLPRPELNPLLNPLLADNMGRWAEVYFTAVPERREEAVLELLRQLEAESARGGGPSKTDLPIVPHADEYPRESGKGFAAAEQSSTHCPSCGHNNPPSHQFCGMCGVKLNHGHSPATAADVASSPPPDPAMRHFDLLPQAESDPEPDVAASSSEPVDSLREPAVPEQATDVNDFSLFRSVSANSLLLDEDWTSEPSGLRRHRVFIAGAMATVVLTLGYIAWRSTQVGQNHRQVSVNQSVAPETQSPAAPSTPQPSPQGMDEPERAPAAATPNAPSTDNRDVAASKTASNAAPGRVEELSASEIGPQGSPATSLGTATGTGNEELAIAQRYLDGGDGLARNSAEAAQWLWKSVAKHNSEATLILADLYLKGDGVSKNCDQARVLLDSAAQKGISAAGERLRHLDAFGCQ
jgi:hypothetical protein